MPSRILERLIATGLELSTPTCYVPLIQDAACEIERLNAQVAMLRTVGESVCDRWDTPLWKDAPATAIFIGELRSAIVRSESDWLTRHDAEVRNAALLEAAKCCENIKYERRNQGNHIGFNAMSECQEAIIGMANEAKP